jgi:hypothetical protein
MGPDVGEGKRSEDGIISNSRRLNVLWTAAYYILLVVGVVAWRKFLWQLTESESALMRF